jgi:3'-phosphoadenosine 5'-phosphosulfate sulfotransferase (PAPS reductase)/FAD synthetase
MSKKTIIVWFSCGAASAVAAKKTIEKYGETHNIRIVNNPIKEEHEDNQRFLKDCEKWLGKTIEFATSSKYPSQSCVEVWEKRKYMSGIAGAPCTLELKKKARQEWEDQNPHDHIVLGFTSEEQHRYDRFKEFERDNIMPILIDEKITKADCYQIITEAGIRLPKIYHLGYPNANCIGCVKATSVTYWNHVRKVHPEVWEHRNTQSREIGCRLVKYKGNRIFLDELPEDAVGRPMKNLDFECGIFCMEQPEEETCDD